MMTKYGNVLSAALLALSIAFLSNCSNSDDNDASQSIEVTTALSVNDAVRNLKADTTVLSVTGVVQTVTPDDGLITLIDIEEYRLCGLNDCCLYMPVLWQGEPPSIEDVVTVQGVIQSTDSGLIFSARDLSVDKTRESQ